MTAAAQRGTTTVSERAVRTIAQRAAGETLPRPGGTRSVPSARAAASVRGGRADLTLGVTLPYPLPLAETVGHVQRHVVERTRELTGLDVPAARLTVTALTPSPQPPEPPSPESGPTVRTPRRRWSRRRLPVALLTAATAVGSGALALDLVRVHLADRAPAAWRTAAVHWLSGHGPGDPAVVAGGALMGLAGVWMVVLALTPGGRRRSSVLSMAPRVDAAMDRSAVAALLRDVLGSIEGVGAVRVTVRRHRVAVRVGLAYGDPGQARAAVTATARHTLAACRLRRVPRLRVAVVPEPVWRPPVPDTTTPPNAPGSPVPAHGAQLPTTAPAAGGEG
ncbi:putative membrane protein [Streptomyces scabiei 87.22]|uniref:Putative membrane protein n=3 Tax=Streptomyces scabiei TaxID=1930 RepID=C9YSW6_STRSW|nr:MULTISPECIES: DUF6286 domain-containing protein [Streptomyces]MBP5871953.1 Asp23/Gls24 family envelope stress response protein [Streptomyces sp. LBUM 1485]MBP5889112.1 Asp23/Gls24 family envelope stress response protein [Streptomyces sp. LBUM 1481]MBP5912004.1 Asp23/Gls24 family envelope stress response protein [Streptomyces sp. LBUM 1486]MBP5919132.1 Asp23/Gls24 family envelope stress response protein [Streptomyces sp. LBUM 1483]MDX2536202.1 DUF6286 domain-containing protein [Streptomyces 